MCVLASEMGDPYGTKGEGNKMKRVGYNRRHCFFIVKIRDFKNEHLALGNHLKAILEYKYVISQRNLILLSREKCCVLWLELYEYFQIN